MKRVCFWCGALLLLAGCGAAGSYDRLSEAAPEAGGFDQSLAAEYLAYAGSQAELGQMEDADYFAGKGLLALEGQEVEPEPATSEALDEARSLLVALLSEANKQALPEQAARAQLLYDCWSHQLYSVAEGEDAPCAAEFDSVSEDLESVDESLTYHNRRKYLLQFNEIDTILTEEMLVDVNQIVEITRGLDEYQVELHAMPQGAGAAHDRIAEVRTQIITEALVERGVSADRIDIEDDTTSKTVYLSHDRKEQPRNSVSIRIKSVSNIPGEDT